MRTFRPFLLALVIFITGIGSLAGQSTPPRVAEPILHPGDVVKITVWLKPELSGEFPIMENGGIAEPFYMDVRIGGLPLSTAAARVRSHVEQFETSPRVLVEPLFRVAVGGEVREPNVYSFRPETSVLEAVMRAGGPTQRGHTDRVRLWRDGREFTFDATRAEGELVRSGDRIVIDRRSNVFREIVLPTIGVMGSIASIIRLGRSL